MTIHDVPLSAFNDHYFVFMVASLVCSRVRVIELNLHCTSRQQACIYKKHNEDWVGTNCLKREGENRCTQKNIGAINNVK